MFGRTRTTRRSCTTGEMTKKGNGSVKAAPLIPPLLVLIAITRGDNTLTENSSDIKDKH